MAKKADNVITSIYLTKEMYKDIETIARKENISKNEVIRTFLEKGLQVQGHKEDIDFITKIIRQELMAIYQIGDIKSIIEKQIERVVKMQMKTGKASASAFFLLIHVVTCMWDNITRDDIVNLLERSTKHGIDYMQLKDYKINQFLEDTDFLLEEVEKLLGK